MNLILSPLFIIFTPTTFVVFMRLFQSLDFLSFINTQVPPIVLELLINLNLNIYKLLPKIIGDINIDDTLYNCNLHAKLLENDVSCISLNTVGFNLAYIGTVYIVKMIVYAPVFLYNSLKSNKKNEKHTNFKSCLLVILGIIRWINNKLDEVFYYWFYKSMEIELFLGSWTTIKSLRVISFWSIFSNLTLVFFFIHSLLCTLLTVKVFMTYYLPREEGFFNKKTIKEYKKSNKKLITLFESQLRPHTNFGILIFLSSSLRDVILPFVLIYFVRYPLGQIISSLIFFTLILGILLLTRPFTTILENSIELFNTVSFIIILIIFLILYLLEGKLSIPEINFYFGYLIVSILVLMTLFNFIYLIYCGIVAAKEYYSRNQRNKVKAQ